MQPIRKRQCLKQVVNVIPFFFLYLPMFPMNIWPLHNPSLGTLYSHFGRYILEKKHHGILAGGCARFFCTFALLISTWCRTYCGEDPRESICKVFLGEKLPITRAVRQKRFHVKKRCLQSDAERQYTWELSKSVRYTLSSTCTSK